MRVRGSDAMPALMTHGLRPAAVALLVCATACRNDDAPASSETSAAASTTGPAPGSSSSAGSTDATSPSSGGGDTHGGSTSSTSSDAGTAGSTSSTSTDASSSSSDAASSSGSSSSTGPGAGASESGEVVIPDGPIPGFTEVSDDVGVWYVQGVIHQAPECLIDQLGPGVNGFCAPERTIAGAAVADVDDDGDVDLFVTRTAGTNLLWINDGSANFTDGTAAAGITEVGNSAGAAFGDIDNDGDADLYVATLSSYAHLLYINDGTGHFTEEGLARNAAMDTGNLHVGTTPTFGDYDLDGYLDVYVGEWRTVDGLGDYPSHARLLRNLGDQAPGSFEDVTVPAGVDIDDVWALGVAAEGSYPFSAAFVDLDGDRFPELTLASDFGTSRLFWNDGDGTFTDRTTEVGAGLDGNGMGSAVGDYDNDGDMDWYVTSITNDNSPDDNRLYRNIGPQALSEGAVELGVGSGGWGWGAAFFEVDNDGDLDLLASAGYYLTQHLDDPLLLWRNDGDGPMVDVSAFVGFGPPRQRRAVTPWDYDDDGDVDIFIANNGDAPELYRNETGNASDWLRVRVVGTTSNRDGLGARVYLRATPDGTRQLREIGVGSHFMGHGERTAHFGLGDGDGSIAEVRVVWPASEAEQVFTDVARNQTLVVVEP